VGNPKGGWQRVVEKKKKRLAKIKVCPWELTWDIQGTYGENKTGGKKSLRKKTRALRKKLPKGR